jgi:hypothetical protein
MEDLADAVAEAVLEAWAGKYRHVIEQWQKEMYRDLVWEAKQRIEPVKRKARLIAHAKMLSNLEGELLEREQGNNNDNSSSNTPDGNQPTTPVPSTPTTPTSEIRAIRQGV